MRIALIDDNIEFMLNLKATLIKQLNLFDLNDYIITTYQNVNELLKCFDQYDVIFVDVEIGNQNGIKLSERIKRKNTDIIIVFISSFSNYVFDSFIVSPFSYILKKELQQNGVKEINRLIRFYINENLKLQIISSNINYNLNQRDIVTIMKNGDRCVFLYKEKIFSTRINLNDLKDTLAPYFVKINKSEIINFYFVVDIHKDVISLKNGNKFYISRRKVKYVTEKWIDYLKTMR